MTKINAILRQQLLIMLLLIVSSIVFGQDRKQIYFQGYTEEVNGKRFGYHSPFPNVNTSLILRGQRDYTFLEWKTEIVPINYSNEYITYIWLFGMDVTSNPVTFNLSVNGIEQVTFSSSKTSELGVKTFQGKNGTELSLNVTMLDKYKDQMGFAILKLPVKAIKLGDPTHLKLSTKTIDNAAWFMTFKTPIEEKIEIYQNKVVAKKEGKLFHSISMDFIYLGEDDTAKITIGDIENQSILKAGFNKVEICLPKVKEETFFTAKIQIANKKTTQKTFSIKPIKEWEIFLVQHTHTDIGYTRPQTEILPEHLKYIDQALDFCDQTDGYPDAAKFRWTCETSW